MKIFNTKRSYKKADLSLSMNAIVILILAITLLGLGLVFLRNLFGQIGEKVTTNLDASNTRVPVDEDRPIGTTPNNLEVEEGKTIKQTLALLNTESGSIDYKLHVYQSTGTQCNNGARCDDVNIIFNEAAVAIDKDKIAEWTITYKPETGAVTSGSSATKLFTLQVECDNGKSTLTSSQCNENKYQTQAVINILK